LILFDGDSNDRVSLCRETGDKWYHQSCINHVSLLDISNFRSLESRKLHLLLLENVVYFIGIRMQNMYVYAKRIFS
jgi:hypothetical protein